MRRSITVALMAALTLGLPVTGAPAVAAPPVAPDDVPITDDGAYVRHDGGTDQAIEHCSTSGSNDTPTDPAGGDADPNDGGNHRQGNEPAVAIDPTNPDLIVAGWNDYCQTDLAAGWQGFAYSTDRGATWTDSTVPGYPADTSPEGMASPLFGTHTDAGDPLVAFDNDGRLFVGGIAFNRAKPQNGDVWVATYGADTHPSGYPKDYLRTVVVGRGVPALPGIFQDKPMLEVDRTGGAHDGNVYVCWSRFVGNAGRTKIFFSRSTDHGETFSKGIAISGDLSVQGCDIAVEADGDVYVSWRSGELPQPSNQAGMSVVRSTDGGATFGLTQAIARFTPYTPFVVARDCGDGPFFCGDPGYVFFRVPLEPRLTADQTGELEGVFATWNAVDPATIVPSTSPYFSAGAGLVGRSVVYVSRSVNDGMTWSDGEAVEDAGGLGHQYFSDIDAYAGRLVAVWQDNRTDDDYSVQLPIGNRLDDLGRAVSSGDDVIGTYAAISDDGQTFTPTGMVSAATHQGQKEMFGNRDIPFQGDYNWVAIADGNGAAAGGLFAYLAWTDNREVVDGADPRELEADGFDDGFDVLQCRVDLGAPAPELDPNVPLARRDAPYSGDNCGNAGGLDQDIYGARLDDLG
jgi:hypothetical protein